MVSKATVAALESAVKRVKRLDPIYPTYEQHQRAALKDRPKHYPDGTIRKAWTDSETWALHYQVTNSMMQTHPKMTTAEYIESFCASNNLIHEAAQVVELRKAA